MRTDDGLFRRALAQMPLSTSRQFAPATAEFISWLQRHSVPSAIIRHFSAWSVPGAVSVEVGFASFWSEQLVRSFHDDTPEYFGAGWLIVGSMPNGDFVVVAFGHDDGAVGYVSHEEVWDGVNHVRDDLQTIYLRVCRSIGEFLVGLLSDKFPYDYFAAREQQRPRA